jgi:predicted metal-dependent HD superfamily phosphohydrolase
MDERFSYTDLAACFLEFAPLGLRNMPEILYQFASLGRRYSAPWRRYHNLDHLFYGYYKHRAFFGHMTPVNFFAWMYHDSVYDPTAMDNENKSTELFLQDNKLIGFDSKEADKITKLILSTKHIGEMNVITDVDLCGLGSSPDFYDANTALIRAEYSMVSDEAWKDGRKSFIERFLTAKRLFFTPKFHTAFEEQARENLRRELSKLQGVRL